jgi:hypothetical protein
MPGSVRLIRSGVKKLLHDPGVIAHLQQRMGAVQAVFQRESTVTTEVYPSGRAIVKVVDDSDGALYREASTGDLARALDAAAAKPNPRGSKWGPK